MFINNKIEKYLVLKAGQSINDAKCIVFIFNLFLFIEIFFVLSYLYELLLFANGLSSTLFPVYKAEDSHLMLYSTILEIMIGVDASILGISIPIALDIIQRLSETFKTPYIGKYFYKKWCFLPVCLAINIILSLILACTHNLHYEKVTWKIFLLFDIFYFIGLLISFLLFANELYSYFNNPAIFSSTLMYDLEKEVENVSS